MLAEPLTEHHVLCKQTLLAHFPQPQHVGTTLSHHARSAVTVMICSLPGYIGICPATPTHCSPLGGTCAPPLPGLTQAALLTEGIHRGPQRGPLPRALGLLEFSASSGAQGGAGGLASHPICCKPHPEESPLIPGVPGNWEQCHWEVEALPHSSHQPSSAVPHAGPLPSRRAAVNRRYKGV